MDNRTRLPGLSFLADGGEAGAIMRGLDWSATPVGRPETWPQSLRTVVNLLLTSKFPMFVAWGPDLVFLYNDGYAPILGAKHPAAMGRPFDDVWFEIWDDIKPLVDRALAGESTFHEDLPLTMLRRGYKEQTYFTFSYSPVRDETGAIAGMFCACTETTEEVRARAALKEEREHLRELFQQAPGFMAVLRGREHVFELVNTSYQQLVGFRDLVGRPIREALPELAGQGFFELLDSVYDTGEPFVAQRLPVKLQRQAGGRIEERFVDFVYQPIKNADRQVTGIFVEGSDVTDQVRSEQAVRESEDHYRHTVELNPQVAWTSTADGQLDNVARRWRDWTGVSGLGSTWGEAIHPDDLQPSIDAWTRSFTTGEPYDIEHRVRLKDGEYHWMRSRAFPRRDAEGRIVKWYGTTEDIHDRRLAERALRDSEARQRAMIAATPDCVMLVARDGRLLDMNPAGLGMIEAQDFATVAGADIRKVVVPEHRAAWQANHERVCRGERLSWEFDIIGLNGTRRRMETHAVPLALPDGTTAQLAVTRDVTARKRAEEHQLLMINELNHRVKNTLATVQSIAAQTLRNAPTMEAAREGFEGRLMALSRVHDVLTRENWESANLREIVAEAIAPFRSIGEQRFRVSGPRVHLMPRMALALAMALQELVTNAVKYGALSNQTGEIRLTWTVDPDSSPARLHLVWQEVGGPPVLAPSRRGFGSRLIERSLAQDLGGEVRIDFAPDGVVCIVDAPLPSD
jgi:PAS domain S-box-containing protein